MSAPNPSGASASRRHCAFDPRRQLRDPRRTLGDQVVGRPERVEGVVAVGQQVLPAVLADADGVREDPQRERVGQRARRRRTPGPSASTSSTSASASASQPSRSLRSDRGLSTFRSTRRGASCRGGSASSSRLGGRHGFSFRKFDSPRRRRTGRPASRRARRGPARSGRARRRRTRAGAPAGRRRAARACIGQRVLEHLVAERVDVVGRRRAGAPRVAVMAGPPGSEIEDEAVGGASGTRTRTCSRPRRARRRRAVRRGGRGGPPARSSRTCRRRRAGRRRAPRPPPGRAPRGSSCPGSP